MDSNVFSIVNGKILTPNGIISDGAIVISNGKIKSIHGKDRTLRKMTEVDAKGCYISPGFIDMHIHGGGGSDFMDAQMSAFFKIAETHACFGTTSMLPTILSSSKEHMLETLNCYEMANQKNEGGSFFLGVHLEGPYFAMSQRGAQDPRYIRNPDPAEYQDILLKFPSVKRWSAAPELPGSIAFCKFAKSKGVLVSMAHTDAIFDEAELGFEKGFSLVTHLYSGMSGVTRKNAFRYAGVVEAAFLIDELDVEIIADGVHLPPPLLRLVYKIKGSGRTALITDAMRAAGMPPGPSILGGSKDGTKVIVEDGVAKLPDRSSFAGSVATADRLVRNMVSMANVSLLEAVDMMTRTPARILGIAGSKGSLDVAKDADIVIFNEQIQIQTTFVKGQLVYQRR